MKIRELMTRDIQLISQDQSIQEAAKLMRDADIGLLPVFNGKNIIGTVSDRDIVIQAVASGFNPIKTKVSDTMSKNVITCDEHDEIEKVAKLMKDYQIRRIIVVDRAKHPVGIVSLGDLARGPADPLIPESILREVSGPRH